MHVLVTGGAGYIGSHVSVELLLKGHEVTILDNLQNSKLGVIDNIEKITGQRPKFINCDIKDYYQLHRVFSENYFNAVSHFAGLKSVSESLKKPLDYYSCNINGTLNILNLMEKHKINNFVFSSSATVYGIPNSLPIKEDSSLSPLNPYAQSKLYVEEFLNFIKNSNQSFKSISLRYFNPVGAHESSLIGEDPVSNLDNIMPSLSNAAIGLNKEFYIFGNDFDTSDGTGVRDYIHVVDLAKGHVSALEYLINNETVEKSFSINLGIGKGISVLEIIKEYERASGLRIPCSIRPRRSGDLAACYSDPSLAGAILGWEAKKDLSTMCKDSWNWAKELNKLT